MTSGDSTALEAVDLRATFRGRSEDVVTALDGVAGRFRSSCLTAVMGPSGSGKTTLLHCLSGILQPSLGCVRHAGVVVSELRDAARDEWRRRHCGLVFQDFRLIDELDPLDNVMLPVLFRKFRAPPGVRDRAVALLDVLGVPRRTGAASRLSRGEQQRVALARALLLDPPIILADEPTASLDRRNAEAIAAQLERMAKNSNKIVVCTTHDERVAERADKVLMLRAGRVIDESELGIALGGEGR